MEEIKVTKDYLIELYYHAFNGLKEEAITLQQQNKVLATQLLQYQTDNKKEVTTNEHRPTE